MTEPVVSTTTGGGRLESEIRASVRKIVIELSPERDTSVPDDARLVDDLGYYSLILLELAFTLEDEFDLSPIEEAVARRITTIAAVQDHVVSELADRGDIRSEG
jgi:acyl carrier protein